LDWTLSFGEQFLSGGGVASVVMNANNNLYGDPCGGTGK
jgi:hypothetical protein